MTDPVVEIKSKLSIVELVSEYVQLKKAGAYYKGLSPFTNEKTPSFYVSPQKDIAYCFSTNQGGDIFTFYQLVENVSFPEALKDLAEKTNVSLSNYNIPKSEDADKKNNLYDIQSELIKIFKKELISSKDHLLYLKNRGVSSNIIDLYDLGLANKPSS